MAQKPSGKEEEYFARMEFERNKKIEEEKHRKLVGAERKRLAALHHMRCPKCGLTIPIFLIIQPADLGQMEGLIILIYLQR